MATKRASTSKTPRKTSNAAGAAKRVLETWVIRAGLEPGVLDALVFWFGKSLASDQFARLEQGGHQEGGIPRRKVFVDLPIGDSSPGHGDPRRDVNTSWYACLRRAKNDPPAAPRATGNPKRGFQFGGTTCLTRRDRSS